MVRVRMTRQFEAVAPVLPEAGRALALMHDTEFNYALVRALGDYFSAGFRILAHTPGLALFAERSSGMIILFSLLLAGEAGDAFPPTAPVPVSIAETARRFGVSRTHILRLFREAEDTGLLTRTGAKGEAILLHPPVTHSAMDFFAAIFLYLASGARTALAEFENTNAGQTMPPSVRDVRL
jgi:AraC-like DNA-binding protein